MKLIPYDFKKEKNVNDEAFNEPNNVSDTSSNPSEKKREINT